MSNTLNVYSVYELTEIDVHVSILHGNTAPYYNVTHALVEPSAGSRHKQGYRRVEMVVLMVRCQ